MVFRTLLAMLCLPHQARHWRKARRPWSEWPALLSRMIMNNQTRIVSVFDSEAEHSALTILSVLNYHNGQGTIVQSTQLVFSHTHCPRALLHACGCGVRRGSYAPLTRCLAECSLCRMYRAGKFLCVWFWECCRQVEADVVSNSRNKLHQTTYKY